MADTKRVSLQQAACNALAKWLDSVMPDDVEVEDRWPDPGVALPGRKITILRAGKRQDETHDPEVVASKPAGHGRRLYRWSLASCVQPIQLDVWATSDVGRDDIDARLDDFLNRGESKTLEADNFDPVRTGLLLKLEDGWSSDIFTTFADFTFEGPETFDTPGAVHESEYRTTRRGQAEMVLTTETESAAITAIVLKLRIAESEAALGTTDTEILTILKNGERRSSSP
jgi:hypothetical protein